MIMQANRSHLRLISCFVVWSVAAYSATAGKDRLEMKQERPLWADAKALAIWREKPVRLVLPATGDRPSRIEEVSAKVTSVQLPRSSPPKYSTHVLSLAAVSDPQQATTNVLFGDAFYVSDEAGMIAVQLTFATLHVWPSIVRVPKPASEAEAIARLASEVTADEVAALHENHFKANIAEGLPLKFAPFFARGSQLVTPEIVGMDLRDHVLRIDLRGVDGQSAVVWLDVASRKVTKTQSGR